MDELVSCLKEIEIFSAFSDSEVRVLAEHSCFLPFSEGQTIFNEGESGEALYYVCGGEVIIRRQRENADPLILASYKKGHSFGELDLLTSSSHTADALAVEESRLLRFPCKGTSFQKILDKYPKISARILHKLLIVISGRIRRSNSLVKENSPLIQELRRQLYGDKLTGLYNKSYLEENIDELLQGADKAALLMFKPDNFKHINDTYGHEIGDASLKVMARQLSESAGEGVVCVRYMGNEMAVVLPGFGCKEAGAAAEKIQDEIFHMDLSSLIKDSSFHLTTSFGIAVFPDHCDKPGGLIALAHELPLIGRARGGGRILFPEDKEESR